MFFASLAWLTIPAAAAPFAPVLDPPKNIQAGSPASIGAAVLKSVKVPDRSAVNVPPYPGAKIIQTQGFRSMTANGKKINCLHYIKLLSKDDGAAIQAFYKKNLPGYHSENKFGGMIRVLWDGPKNFNSMDITQACRTPNVLITGAAGTYDDLMPGAKTVIEITYP